MEKHVWKQWLGGECLRVLKVLDFFHFMILSITQISTYYKHMFNKLDQNNNSIFDLGSVTRVWHFMLFVKKLTNNFD